MTFASEIHHLKNVLRLKKGDKIVAFNGEGKEADGIIQSLNAGNIQVNILAVRTDPIQTLSIILACAVPKKAKFETIIEKCTELGVDHIIPLKTERTEIRLEEARLEQKLRRYRTIAINAAKQSQRKSLPAIHPFLTLQSVLREFLNSETLTFIFCLDGNRRPLKEAVKAKKSYHKRILLLIGPEGDFTRREIDAACLAGSLAVSLGENVLKVDTAAMAVTAIIRQLLGTHPV